MGCTNRIQKYLDQTMESQVLEQVPNQLLGYSSENKPVGELTKRQHEIALLVSDGLSNKEIAKKLGISPSTVKNHITTIHYKLCVDRRGKIHIALRE